MAVLVNLVLFLYILKIASVTGLTEFEKKYERKLGSVDVNPNCEKSVLWCHNSSFTGGSLMQVVGKGPKDELHHLFSTVGAPTLMISRTKPGAKLVVDYDHLLSTNHTASAVSFAPKGAVDHSFGIIFSRIYEFNDHKDEANLSIYADSPNDNYPHSLTDLRWTLEKLPYDETDDMSSRAVMVNATTTGNHSLLSGDGHLSFIVQCDGKDGRLKARPHMEQTANSSIVTVIMSKFNTRFTSSRFAIELIMFSTDDKGQDWNATQVHTSTSLDDEYSPGVFQMRNWLPNENKKREDAWGYAQWKPVVYTNDQRRNADLSHATSYPNLPYDKNYTIHKILPNRTLFSSYFGLDTSQVLMNATNVSFGITKDKFYAGTNYLVWTVAVGMGPPPDDGVSTLVILVIAIGLGIPLVLMIFSSVFVCVKNFRKRKANESSYTAINT